MHSYSAENARRQKSRFRHKMLAESAWHLLGPPGVCEGLRGLVGRVPARHRPPVLQPALCLRRQLEHDFRNTVAVNYNISETLRVLKKWKIEQFSANKSWTSWKNWVSWAALVWHWTSATSTPKTGRWSSWPFWPVRTPAWRLWTTKRVASEHGWFHFRVCVSNLCIQLFWNTETKYLKWASTRHCWKANGCPEVGVWNFCRRNGWFTTSSHVQKRVFRFFCWIFSEKCSFLSKKTGFPF